MSNNVFQRLRNLLPLPAVLVGTVLEIHDDDTSTVEIPGALPISDYSGNVATGSLIRPRGTSVPVGKKAFVRAGVIETQAPDGAAVPITVGTIITPPPPVPAPSTPPTVAWTGRPNIADVAWVAVAVNSSKFVVVGNDINDGTAKVATSPDGITWTARTFPANTFDSGVHALMWDSRNSLFIMAGKSASASNMMTSPDGITWTLRSSGAAEGIARLAGNSACVVAFCNNRITGALDTRALRSTNGTSWSAITLPTFGDYTDYFAVCWSSTLNLFVVFGVLYDFYFITLTSSDGSTWTEFHDAAVMDGPMSGVVQHVSALVAVGGAKAITSPDAAGWTIRTPLTGVWQSIASNGTILIAVGHYGATNTVMVSYNGAAWAADVPSATNNWASVCFGLGIFVAVGPPYDADFITADSIMTRS